MATIGLREMASDWVAGWSAHDIERVVSLCTDDCVYEDVPMAVVNRGKEALRAFGRQVFGAFPDLKVDLSSYFAAGDGAVLEWVMSGTHEGDLPGLPATGASFSVRGVTVLVLKDGRISRNSDYWDLASVLTQLGLMPARASN